MTRWTLLIAVVLVSLFTVLGCSGGDSESAIVLPTEPEIASGLNQPGQAHQQNTSLLGFYTIYVDPQNQTMEVVESRTVSYTINVVPFLNKIPSPQYGISFGSINIDNTDPALLKIDVEFKWHHPFPTLQQYKVYDFMGVIITDGDMYPGYQGLRRSKRGVNTYMTNADGYTRWFNPTEFTSELIFGWAPGGMQNWKGNAHLNPYKAYGQGLAPNGDLWEWLDGGSNNNGVFQTGTGRIMSLEFPVPPNGDGLVFGYAAVCCWEEQFSGPYTPYHRDEPIACRVDVTDDIYYIDMLNQGGNLILDIDIWSWDEQPDVVRIESTVFVTSHETLPPIAGGDNWSTYQFDVPIEATLSSTEGHEFWVVAECSGYNYINVEGVPAPPPDQRLASFFRYPLYISSDPGNQPPVCEVNSQTTLPYHGPLPVTITFDASGSTDPDLDPLTFAWDTDNDGQFDDATGPTADVEFTASGTYTVCVEVSDGKGESSICCVSDFIINAAPVCDLVVDDETPLPAEDFSPVTVKFDATASYEPDGETLTFEWDFDGDGIYDEDPDDNYTGDPDNPTHLYFSSFNGDVSLRLTDGNGGESICSLATMVTAHQSKNLTLRSGDQAVDLGVDPSNGDLWIVYEDRQVWFYTLDGWYDDGTYKYQSNWNNADVIFMDVASGGYAMYMSLGHPGYGKELYIRDMYGNTIYGTGIGSSQEFFQDCTNFGTSGTYANDLAMYFGSMHVSGTYYFVYLYEFAYPYTSRTYLVSQYKYPPLIGYDGVFHEYVQGMDTGLEGTDFWFLEAPDYYCAAFYKTSYSSWYHLTYHNSYFGTGSEETDESGWTADVCDLGRDDTGRFHVLDNVSGTPAIKVFTGSSTGGTAHGSYGDSTSISSTPLNLDGSDFDGKMLVLHGNISDGYFISIFMPDEMPL